MRLRRRRHVARPMVVLWWSWLLLAAFVSEGAAQTCLEMRDIRRQARLRGQDGPALALLEQRICVGRLYRVGSPTCEELKTMELIVQLEPPQKRANNPLEGKHRREVSQLRRAVCSGSPHATSRSWSTAKLVVVEPDTLYYPNGSKARGKKRQWFYPSGKRARTKAGKWIYPSRQVAKTPGGEWVLPDGQSVDVSQVRREACAQLGPDLCFGARGVDPDLIDAAIMSLLTE